MKTKLILILGILLVSLQACQRESEMVAPEIDGNMVAAVSTGSGYSPGDGAIQRPVSKKERVIMNCRTVQAAVEQFAAENGGMYPWNLADRSLAGHAVIDLLPESRLLENPFWHCNTEPIDGSAATPGQIGYVVISCEDAASGYCITGWGRYNRLICLYRDCSGEVTEVLGP